MNIHIIEFILNNNNIKTLFKYIGKITQKISNFNQLIYTGINIKDLITEMIKYNNIISIDNEWYNKNFQNILINNNISKIIFSF